jgi:hypothetical protein
LLKKYSGFVNDINPCYVQAKSAKAVIFLILQSMKPFTIGGHSALVSNAFIFHNSLEF